MPLSVHNQNNEKRSQRNRCSMSEILDLANILEAAVFAARKHQGQMRKDQGKSPYVTHPLLVAKSIWEIGGVDDTRTLIAAVLHDTIEDTLTTETEIEDRFGAVVRSIVCEVTDDKSLEKMERKRQQVVHAPHLSRPARLIKLADKLINCQDILYSPPEDWTLERRRNYIQWSADVIAKIRNTNAPLENAFDSVLIEAEKKLNYAIQTFETVNQRSWGPKTS